MLSFVVAFHLDLSSHSGFDVAFSVWLKLHLGFSNSMLRKTTHPEEGKEEKVLPSLTSLCSPSPFFMVGLIFGLRKVDQFTCIQKYNINTQTEKSSWRFHAWFKIPVRSVEICFWCEMDKGKRGRVIVLDRWVKDAHNDTASGTWLCFSHLLRKCRGSVA